MLGGVVGPTAFIATWATLGARTQGYSPVHDPISRLAAVDAPNRSLMTAGLLVFGVGVGAYARELRDAHPGGAGTAALACAVGSLGVAATPLESSLGGTPHAVVASLTYASLAAVPLLAARSLRSQGRSGAARMSIAAGLATGACLVASTVPSAHTGLWQRLGFVIGDAWLIGSALQLLRTRDR